MSSDVLNVDIRNH